MDTHTSGCKTVVKGPSEHVEHSKLTMVVIASSFSDDDSKSNVDRSVLIQITSGCSPQKLVVMVITLGTGLSCRNGCAGMTGERKNKSRRTGSEIHLLD